MDNQAVSTREVDHEIRIPLLLLLGIRFCLSSHTQANMFALDLL